MYLISREEDSESEGKEERLIERSLEYAFIEKQDHVACA